MSNPMKALTAILIALMTLVIENTSGQNAMPNGGFSVAASAGMRAYDSEIGIEIGTPSFFKGSVCFRIKGNIAWLESYNASYDQWARYKSLTGVLVYNTNMLERSRVYAEFGAYFIFPDQTFSSSSYVQGITGSLGVELFFSPKSKRASYFFSGGVAYIDAIADKIEDQPSYGSGFVFSNGLRFYF